MLRRSVTVIWGAGVSEVYGTPPGPPDPAAAATYSSMPPPSPPPGTTPYTAYHVATSGPAALGQIRSTGKCFGLMFITFGVYGYFWMYSVHEEMKAHRSGEGLGGALAVVLWFFVGPVMAFLTPDEVGKMYKARGQQQPVSALTGLWFVPGFLLLFVGPIVWFVKTNAAINDYWRSLGAT
jgi:hypothetical protein